MERLRAEVEARLLRGYDIGAKQALGAIEASIKQSPAADVTSDDET